MTRGMPESTIATSELVVPKSIPTILFMLRVLVSGNSDCVSIFRIESYFSVFGLSGSHYRRAMHCIVTAGPTFEPLDEVRRLTNFSTGQSGAELAAYLTTQGHRVTLMIGEQATYRGPRLAESIEVFTTTADLEARLASRQNTGIGAVFHAAAVSDFAFAKVFLRSATGQLSEVRSGKFTTRDGPLLAELVPTPKILSRLRDFFPTALLMGWKYETDGNRDSVLEMARRQMAECRSDACVANGPAYGEGYGLATNKGAVNHLANRQALFDALQQMLLNRPEMT